MLIKPLTNVGIEEIHHAFKEAFSDYAEPFDLSKDQLNQMITRRGYKPDLSFGTYAEDKIVGFTLNGLGTWNNQKTAYDTGTGVIKSYRQKGVASRIFEASLPVLAQHDITHYLLEVIKVNTKAIDLYNKMGFEITREFDYWVTPVEKLPDNGKSLNASFSVERVQDPNWIQYQEMWDFQPSWQNSVESITRKLNRFVCLEVLKGDRIVAYGFMEQGTGDLPQLAVHPDYRRIGLGTQLVFELLDAVQPENLKVINTQADSMAMKGFLQYLGLNPGHGQYEMIREL